MGSLNATTGFVSYKPLLGLCCSIIKPDLVVEYGPGESTAFLLANTTAKIYSWEDDSNYANRATERFAGQERVTIHKALSGKGNGKNTAYINAPFLKFKMGSVPFVFIDGRARADCLIAAYFLISDLGVVVLHDDTRPTYDEGRILYPYSFRSPRTLTGVYSKNEAAIKEISAKFDLNEVPDIYGGYLPT
jgi:predicted O-methyltransferase YrrM